MRKNILAYILIYLIIVIIMSAIGLEMDFDIIYYLLLYCAISIGVVLLFKRKYSKTLNNRIILGLILLSILSSYILMAIIQIAETNTAYNKVKSIPKETLITFYNTGNINIIPKKNRRTWIGIFYKEISLVKENRIEKIKAVGWRGNTVFSYYDIVEDDFIASYH